MKASRSSKKTSGFTLVELIVVLVILATLAALLVAMAMIAILRALGMYVPPAGALCILPMLLPPERLPLYPLQITLGTALFLTLAITVFPERAKAIPR